MHLCPFLGRGDSRNRRVVAGAAHRTVCRIGFGAGRAGVADRARSAARRVFVSGSDRHYPEERSAHERRVAAFAIERHPVTNAQYALIVTDTGYRTVAEEPVDPADFPGADPAQLRAGALVFTATDGPVDLGDWTRWWRWVPGAHWRAVAGRAVASTIGPTIRWCISPTVTRPSTRAGGPAPADGGRMGVRGVGRADRYRVRLGIGCVPTDG